ncbi:MAG: hypothetical protein ABIB79_02790 [archaeon]
MNNNLSQENSRRYYYAVIYREDVYIGYTIEEAIRNEPIILHESISEKSEEFKHLRSKTAAPDLVAMTMYKDFEKTLDPIRIGEEICAEAIFIEFTSRIKKVGEPEAKIDHNKFIALKYRKHSP